MKRNFRKLLSVVLSLVMVFTCLASVGITAFAEETAATEEVVAKKGPFDFTDATDLSYGNGATVENGKLKIDIKNDYGAAWARFPFEIVKGTEYSVRFKIKLVSTGWTNLTLKTAYAIDSGIGFEHTNSAHIASQIVYDNNITKNEWTDIEYTFTASNPPENYKYLGLFMQSSKAASIYIDNLQITPVTADAKPTSATFNFDDASDLEYYVGTYGAGSAKVEEGKLNVKIPNANYRLNTRFPFILQEGKTYKVKFDLTANAGSGFGIHFAYNSVDSTVDNPSNRLLINNYYPAAGYQTTVEYTFTATIPATGFDSLGLLFWANAAGVDLSIDNLEIILLDAESACYDFSNDSDLEYYVGTYSAGSAKVEEGKLNVKIPNANYRLNTRFPFILQEGKTYKVKFDLTANAGSGFGIYFAYNSVASTVDNPSNRLLINNYYPAAGYQTTVEYTFTAAIPTTDYDRFGLLFWANAAGVDITIDNLEITTFVEPENAYYDFSSSSDVADSYISYGNAVFQDEMLKLSIPSANCRAKVKFPFELQNGETYRVRFDIKADTAMENLVQIAYAGTGTGDNLIAHGTNIIVGGWEALNSEFKTLEYTFTANCPENNENIGIYINAGGVSGNVIYIDNFYILKDYLAPDTPNAPDMASHTESSITLMDMLGYEYKIDDGEWQTSPVFENLVQGQTYSFYQRVAATDIYGATASSEALVYFIANYGDADRSGEIDTADLVLIRKVLLGVDEVYDEFAADIKDDGVINIIDLVKLKKVLGQKKNPVTPDFLSGSYELAWNDEFDGESLDSTKWNTGTYSFDNAYGGVTYIAANNNAGVLEVADGYLALNNYSVENESGGYDYYTPEICTNKAYNFSYGYFEMRAKLASGNPLWHSFWACGSNTDEMPYRAEIDVIETHSNGVNNGTYEYTVHSWWDKDATNLPDGMTDDTTGHKVLVNGSAADDTFASEFHNYGCLWTETSLTFYLDGEVLREVVFAEDENSDYFLALKDGNPMSLILSLSTARQEAGTDNPVTINNEILADQVMLVDYVRVYQDTVIGG